MTATLAPPAEPWSAPAPTGRHRAAEGRGELTIDPQVVEKIATTAATEVEHVGGAARRVAGLVVGSDTSAVHPRVSARVAGDSVTLTVTCSVGYPAPVAAVTEKLRTHVSTRVDELTGLHTRSVDISVAALTTSGPRVTGRELS